MMLIFLWFAFLHTISFCFHCKFRGHPTFHGRRVKKSILNVHQMLLIETHLLILWNWTKKNNFITPNFQQNHLQRKKNECGETHIADGALNKHIIKTLIVFATPLPLKEKNAVFPYITVFGLNEKGCVTTMERV